MSSSAGIMQPYFFPYIGYFQLIGQVDDFVLYDNVKYTKKGWINRNRILQDGHPVTITLPLKGGSDFLEIGQRQIADAFRAGELLNKVANAYRKAPFFDETWPLLESILSHEVTNLFDFLRNAITAICAYLELSTRLLTSSRIEIAPGLVGQDRIIALCRKVGATTYINPIGGKDLYSPGAFEEAGIRLRFLRSRLSPYPQGGHAFVEALSIIDVLCFNGRKATTALVARDFLFEH